GRVGPSAQGEGAGRGRVSATSRRARPLHVPAHRRGRTADACTARQWNHGRRLRDGRDGRRTATAAGTYERNRGPPRRAGRCVLPGEAARGRGPVAGRRPGRGPGRGGGDGRRDGGLHLGWDRPRLGANVTILDRSIDRMRHLDEILSGRVSLVMSSSLQIEESVAEADVVIGAVLIPGARAPKLVTREMIDGMKQGAVVVDVAIDQGGCFETSRPTTHSEPVYTVA